MGEVKTADSSITGEEPAMCRDELLRIFELRDSLPTSLPEGVAFPRSTRRLSITR